MKKMDPEIHFLSLLRGVNVGGNNIIKMTDLKSCFENMGFTGVLTYIQSGNIIFKSTEKDKIMLTDKIEQALSDKFNYTSRIVVIPFQELKDVVEKAPAGFGKEPDKYRYDVFFLKEPLIPDELMKKINTRDGVDKAYAGATVLYFLKLISKASQSYLPRIISLPEYQYITIRNWNTTTKLLALMEE
jgi:uncharacterized protein (DUF1697 family)